MMFVVQMTLVVLMPLVEVVTLLVQTTLVEVPMVGDERMEFLRLNTPAPLAMLAPRLAPSLPGVGPAKIPVPGVPPWPPPALPPTNVQLVIAVWPMLYIPPPAPTPPFPPLPALSLSPLPPLP